MVRANFRRLFFVYTCFVVTLIFSIFALLRTSLATESPVVSTTEMNSSESAGNKDSFHDAVQAVKNRRFQYAVQLFTKLSEVPQYDGQYEAQFNLAVLLKQGKGRPQNYAEAMYWARRAELGGIEKAKYFADDIDDLITDEQYVEICERIKISLLREIDAGAISVLPQLANFHITLLEDHDYEQAYIWFSLAVALDLPEQEGMRSEMEDELDTEQVAELQKETGRLFDALLAGESLEAMLRPAQKE